jgi:hypothetical protein
MLPLDFPSSPTQSCQFSTLTANLLTPEYPALYMVQSDVMHELQCGPRKSEFEGTVGTIVPKKANDGFHEAIWAREIPAGTHDKEYVPKIQVPENYVGRGGRFEVPTSEIGPHETIPTFDRTQRISNLVAIAIGMSALVIPYVLIAIFSHSFETGTLSTPLQRGFVMSWLVVGQVIGAFWGWLGHDDSTYGNVFSNFHWSELQESGGLVAFFFVVAGLLAVITPFLGRVCRCMSDDQAIWIMCFGLRGIFIGQ